MDILDGGPCRFERFCQLPIPENLHGARSYTIHYMVYKSAMQIGFPKEIYALVRFLIWTSFTSQ